MTELEGQQTSSPEEVSFKAKGKALEDAIRNLVGFIDSSGGIEGDQLRWKSGETEPIEEEREAAKGFIQNLLDYREEGRWDSIEDALAEEGGISLGEEDRGSLIRLKDFLERQGIIEEELGGEEQKEEKQEAPAATAPESKETQGGLEVLLARLIEVQKEGQRSLEDLVFRLVTGRSSKGMSGAEKANLVAEFEEKQGEEGGMRGAGEFYERWRQQVVDELNGIYPVKNGKPQRSELAKLVDESTKSPLSRRRQYLTLILAEHMRTGSYLEKQKVDFLMCDEGDNTDEAAMAKVVKFVQTCQGVATGTTKAEQTEQTIGDPGPEIFLGLRNLYLKVEIETENGEKYSGYISPLHMMDIMNDPEWCHRLMTNRFDPEDLEAIKDPEDPEALKDLKARRKAKASYKECRGFLLDELLHRRLKNEKGDGLPIEARVKSTNLYSFAKRRRIDNSQEKTIGIPTRGLVLGELWWLHDAAWYVFCVGGRQRAWDKALAGRWQLPQQRRPLLPANYNGIKYENGLWARREFFRITMWYDFWSEQGKYILPIFLAEKDEKRLTWEDKEWQIISRKVMRKGALPHLVEEESKIALGLGEYSRGAWSEKAGTWLSNRDNITRKGEMKAWSEMESVDWTDEERRLIAEVDFRPALRRMQVITRELKKSCGVEEPIEIKGETKGIEGYNQVVRQLSFQNLDYSAVEQKAWLSQMSYTTAADISAKEILYNFWDLLNQPSSWGIDPTERGTASAEKFWQKRTNVKSQATEAVRRFVNAIAYVSPGERTEAGTELLWGVAQAYTYCQREYLPRIKKRDGGWWGQYYVTADRIPEDRRKALELLGYQFIEIGGKAEKEEGEEGREETEKEKKAKAKKAKETKVFGPSGSPVIELDRYEGYYCAVEDQFGGRPLGWRFINSLGKAALQANLIGDYETFKKIMDEIRRVVPDEWPSRLEVEGGKWRLGKLMGIDMGKRRTGKRV